MTADTPIRSPLAEDLGAIDRMFTGLANSLAAAFRRAVHAEVSCQELSPVQIGLATFRSLHGFERLKQDCAARNARYAIRVQNNILRTGRKNVFFLPSALIVAEANPAEPFEGSRIVIHADFTHRSPRQQYVDMKPAPPFPFLPSPPSLQPRRK